MSMMIDDDHHAAAVSFSARLKARLKTCKFARKNFSKFLKNFQKPATSYIEF